MKRKVTMRTMAAGPDGVLLAGQEYLLDEKQARALIEGGYATWTKGAYISAPAPIETASVEVPEKAVSPRGRLRKAASSHGDGAN